MRRFHLFEFNDSPWCPRFVRDSVVEVLGRVIARGPIARECGPLFATFVKKSGAKRVLDIGSGTGMTTAAIVRAAEGCGISPPKVTLSDLLGGREARGVSAICNGHCRFWPEPVDAMAVDPAIDHDGRTFFCLFHHFRPGEARKVIAAAVDASKAVMIMEPFPRRLLYLRPFFFSSLFAYFANPFLARRDRFLKFIFTWLCPILPFLGLWDGVVSTLRIHNEAELMAMAREAGPAWRWEFHRVPFGRFREIHALMGFPNILPGSVNV